ncbi:hypothetical protein CJJ18_11740 (plasmid) [Candidatus Williamhamiltonella defendens]|uniref:Uncharacterized protein n=1 Tax=Candidatus Williamhamiltonella defendens TaxID=138072 RepID=A0A4P2SQU0_9ENTR|nr:hypothetical protein [Candidatus Hamiltonella defensa]ASV34618.1 hypothetical protein CJJ18_11705 [Candidatus Hamiltonella defensa]ASV34621.1 hypothetical protein CJJ18_11740 [Candidatus Hamiltonella defensa]AWK17583.1 hypothetical protein CCS40_11500 [Candidatus Hamiltonella defensa]AWK17585.1 hypothetical protein CCS40_11535 [Candidatus Hamiltonella defensa]AWK17589.1 hypothetical protein CCS40_11570 [Candidatus Hamiltonella defensa]
MATKKPRSKFIDIYWIICRNSNTPSGKVLLTRKERSPFKVMFKEGRLLWAGRKPVREGSL